MAGLGYVQSHTEPSSPFQSATLESTPPSSNSGTPLMAALSGRARGGSPHSARSRPAAGSLASLAESSLAAAESDGTTTFTVPSQNDDVKELKASKPCPSHFPPSP